MMSTQSFQLNGEGPFFLANISLWNIEKEIGGEISYRKRYLIKIFELCIFNSRKQ